MPSFGGIMSSEKTRMFDMIWDSLSISKTHNLDAINTSINMINIFGFDHAFFMEIILSIWRDENFKKEIEDYVEKRCKEIYGVGYPYEP